MKKKLEGRSALIFVENLFEDLELFYPLYRLLEEGVEVVTAGPKAKELYQSKYGYPCRSDRSFQEVREESFDALIIPGGYAPDKMRRDPAALEIVRRMHREGKIIAFICHAGWVPISAGVLKGVKCTSCSSIKDDMINAGAEWVERPLVVDGRMISSPTREDLPAFCPAILEALAHVCEPVHA